MSEWVTQISDQPSGYTLDEPGRNNNAYCFYSYMSNRGWTLEAIAGALGNIREESVINPGACEYNRGIPRSGSEYFGGGLGLIQWTDYPPYIQAFVNPLLWYAARQGANWYSGNLQCELIELCDDYETTCCGTDSPRWGWQANPYAYIPFSEYKEYTGSVSDAARIWFYSIERGDSASLNRRISYAEYWYEYLSGQEPEPDPDDPTNPEEIKKRKMPIWFVTRKRYMV